MRPDVFMHRRYVRREAQKEKQRSSHDQRSEKPGGIEIENRATEQGENDVVLEPGIRPDVLASPARQDALVSILTEQDEEQAGDDPAVNDDSQAPSADDVPADKSDGESSAVDAV